MLTIMLLASAAIVSPFPERVPSMMEHCLTSAVAAGETSDTDDSHKYMCVGEPAQQLWDWLAAAKLPSYEQDTATEGRWLSRDFPLGACFKRTLMADGSAATSGLSCTIWIPRPNGPAEPSEAVPPKSGGSR